MRVHGITGFPGKNIILGNSEQIGRAIFRGVGVGEIEVRFEAIDVTSTSNVISFRRP